MDFASPRFAGNTVLEEILNDPDTGTKKLQPGSDSDAVARVQQALFDLGWSLAADPPVATAEEFVDGAYGPATTRTVVAYKTHYDLRFPPDDPNGFIDGFAGPRTLRKLDPQVVLLDEADAAILEKIPALQAGGLDVQPGDRTTIFDDSPGAVRPATIDGTAGGIFYKRGIGAFEVHGAIFASYTAEHGGAEGDLGYPVTDEEEDPDVDGGRMSEFEHGTLFWNATDGVTRGRVETSPVQRVVLKIVDEIALGLAPEQPVTPGELASLVDSPEGPSVAEAVGALVPDALLRPVFDLAGTPELDEMIATARENDPDYSPPNFSNFLEFDCPDDVDPEPVVAALKQWAGVVESAYVAPLAEDPAVVGTTNPRFSQQGYLAAAPQGIGVQAAWAKGADGTGTSFIDLERGWFLEHEDLPAGIQLLEGVNTAASRPHGTGILGIVVAQDNTVGIAGIAPATFPRVISYINPRVPRDERVANAITKAARALPFGGVLLLEVETRVLSGRVKKVPVEFVLDRFRAIELAVKFGVVVVEPAANGGLNLDDLENEEGKKSFARGHADFKDSGAIMVAACTSAQPHSRVKVSNFGSRIDCCAWGDSIVTTGADATPTKKDAYRNDGRHTSGASAIIAGVCLLVQDMRTRLTPKSGTGKLGGFRLRRILSDPNNGTATTGTEPIGPMPDLAKIVANEFV